MKLATLKRGGRDGTLAVVSRDLAHCQTVAEIAATLQQALDDWDTKAPQLAAVYEALNHGAARHAEPFDPRLCASPLPRAYQWADGSAYVNHVELVRKARGAELPPELLDRSADVPGRLGFSFAGPARSDPDRRQRGLGHRFRGRGGGGHRRPADGRHAGSNAKRRRSAC
jgi:hypothetical protein